MHEPVQARLPEVGRRLLLPPRRSGERRRAARAVGRRTNRQVTAASAAAPPHRPSRAHARIARAPCRRLLVLLDARRLPARAVQDGHATRLALRPWPAGVAVRAAPYAVADGAPRLGPAANGVGRRCHGVSVRASRPAAVRHGHRTPALRQPCKRRARRRRPRRRAAPGRKTLAPRAASTAAGLDINPFGPRTQTGSGVGLGGCPFSAPLGASSRPTSAPTRGGRALWMCVLRLRPNSHGGSATAAG